MPDKKIKLILEAKDKATKSLNKFRDSIKSLSPAITGVATAWVSWKAFTSVLDKTVGAAARQEEIFNRLRNAVNITGESYEDAKPKIDSFLRTMQDTTRYGDTDVAPVLQQIVTLTGDLEKGFEGTKLAADIAAAGLFDMNTAARYMAMAMEGNVEMLGRYIPELRTSYGLINSNMTAQEKWAIASDLLKEKFGGMAAGELNTLVGQMDRFKNEMSDLAEAIGDLVLPVLTPLVSGLASLARFFNSAKTSTEEFIETQKRLGREIKDVTKIINEQITSLENYTAGIKDVKVESQSLLITQLGLNSATTDATFSFIDYKNMLVATKEEMESIDNWLKDINYDIDNTSKSIDEQGEVIPKITVGLKYIATEANKSFKLIDAVWNRTTLSMASDADKLWDYMTKEEREMCQIMAKSFDAFSDRLVDAMFDTRTQFKDIFQGMAKDFLKYFIKKALAMLINSFIPGLGSILGGIFDKQKNDMMAATQGQHFMQWFTKGAIEELQSANLGETITKNITAPLRGYSNLGWGYNNPNINIYVDNFIGEESWIKERIVPVIETAIDEGSSNISKLRKPTDVEY